MPQVVDPSTTMPSTSTFYFCSSSFHLSSFNLSLPLIHPLVPFFFFVCTFILPLTYLFSHTRSPAPTHMLLVSLNRHCPHRDTIHQCRPSSIHPTRLQPHCRDRIYDQINHQLHVRQWIDIIFEFLYGQGVCGSRCSGGGGERRVRETRPFGPAPLVGCLNLV